MGAQRAPGFVEERSSPSSGAGPALSNSWPEDLGLSYVREMPHVLRYLQRLGIRRADRRDLAHEVFVRFFRAIRGHYQRDRPLRAWLLGVSFHVAMEMRRSFGRQKAWACLRMPLDSEDGPEELLSRREDVERVRLALTKIAPSRRILFVMAEFEGYSMPEIAKVLSLPLNSAYSRLRIARVEFARAVQLLPG
jgi:RNA polymerase sigma-70 factor (ECF subfamily)